VVDGAVLVGLADRLERHELCLRRLTEAVAAHWGPAAPGTPLAPFGFAAPSHPRVCPWGIQ